MLRFISLKSATCCPTNLLLVDSGCHSRERLLKSRFMKDNYTILARIFQLCCVCPMSLSLFQNSQYWKFSSSFHTELLASVILCGLPNPQIRFTTVLLVLLLKTLKSFSLKFCVHWFLRHCSPVYCISFRTYMYMQMRQVKAKGLFLSSLSSTFRLVSCSTLNKLTSLWEYMYVMQFNTAL